ncbi:MAG: hypothetical protein WDN28_11170 [Chthoniobacter sp.]
MTNEDYVHRIGRTGRANAVGDALSFVCPDEHGDLRSLERFIGRGLPRKRLDSFDYAGAAPPEPPRPPRGPSGQRGGQGQGRGNGGGNRRGGSGGGGGRSSGRGNAGAPRKPAERQGDVGYRWRFLSATLHKLVILSGV